MQCPIIIWRPKRAQADRQCYNAQEGYTGGGRPNFEKMTGRKYGFFEEYSMEDAEYAVVIIGSAAGTCKAAIDAYQTYNR